MKIDEYALFNDVNRLIDYIARNQKPSSIHELNEYYGLVQLIHDMYGIILGDDFFFDVNKKYKILENYDLKNIYKLDDTLREISPDILKMSKIFNKGYDRNMDYYADHGSNIGQKVYSEKEFKDLLLSFYSKYGDRILSIVRKYINDDKIHTSNQLSVSETAGYTTKNRIAKNSYIISGIDKYNTTNAIVIAHELGHAIDSELLFYSQGKKLSQMSDPFVEVPSCIFEVAFMDYLINNRIDVRNALSFLNYRIVSDVYGFKKYKKRINNDEYFLSLDGYLLDKENEYGEKLDEEEDNLRDDLIYYLGYMVALNVLIKYRGNEKDLFKKYNNFICMRKENTFKQSIKELGLNYDDFINCKLVKPYVKEKSDDLKMILNKKNKN